MKKLVCLLLCCLLMLTAAAAEGYLVVDDEEPSSSSVPPVSSSVNFPRRGESFSEDPEAGRWSYRSPTLRIEIVRMSTEKPRRIWYEAEVWANGDIWGIVTA